jgi:hypothetical protein
MCRPDTDVDGRGMTQSLLVKGLAGESKRSDEIVRESLEPADDTHTIS